MRQQATPYVSWLSNELRNVAVGRVGGLPRPKGMECAATLVAG